MPVHRSSKKRPAEQDLLPRQLPRPTPNNTLHSLFSAENRQVLDDLPILSFLARKDRLSLAETCSSSRNAVESYSKRNVQAIFDVHRVDNTFVDRITAQGHLPTSRRRPLILPYRYMLHMAMDSHLYKLHGLDELRCVLQVSISCDGTRLLTMLEHGIVQVWDLYTKECLQTIQHDFWDEDGFEGFVLKDNNRILLRGNNHVVSWDMHTGRQIFATSLEQNSFREEWNLVSISSCNKSLMLDDADGVIMIDTDSGDVVLVGKLLPWPPPEYYHGRDGDESARQTFMKSNVFICHDKWFVFAAWWSDEERAGIFVFSLKDLKLVSQNKFAYARYENFLQTTDNPETFVAAGHGNVDIYTVNSTNGLIKLRNTFAIPLVPEYHDAGPLFATASNVYLQGRCQEKSKKKIDVYDIDTGTLQRCLSCPCSVVYALTIWKDNNEFILGLAHRSVVAAYCLVEPEQQSH